VLPRDRAAHIVQCLAEAERTQISAAAQH
jgi:hypothetical protein